MEGTLSLGLKKGAWTAEEDGLLRNCIETYGEGKWHLVPIRAGLNRCRKSCRLRWLNYLKPSINREAFSADEVDLIIRLHKLLGNRWSLIAGRLPGRTANDVKNYWNTHLSKKHEPCKVKTVKKKVKFPATPPAKKIDVIRPQPRSFSSSRYLPIKGHLGIKFPGNVTNNNNNNNNNNNEDDDDYNICGTNTNNDNSKFMEDDMTTYKFNPPESRSGEKAWWESLFEESEGSDEKMAEAVVPVVAPLTTAVEEAQGSWMGSNLSLSTFDVDLWNLLHAENGGLN